MRIVYDTEFVDDGLTIAPLSIAMRRQDGEHLYAVNDSLENLARACENAWMIEHVLKWLPVEVTWGATPSGMLSASVAWNEDHPDYAYVKPLSDIAEMVEDFVLEKHGPQLWAYYGAYDHVFLAQLFGPMVELPDGFPMYTMDVKHECVMRGDPRMPQLPDDIVKSEYDGVRREHDARYDAHEEEYRLEWLLRRPR